MKTILCFFSLLLGCVSCAQHEDIFLRKYEEYDFNNFKNYLIVFRSNGPNGKRILWYDLNSSCKKPIVLEFHKDGVVDIISKNLCSRNTVNKVLLNKFIEMNINSIEVDSCKNVYIKTLGEESINIVKCNNLECCKNYIKSFKKINNNWYHSID